MKQTSMRSFLKVLVYSTFFIPLVLLSQHFIFPFIVPKILLFRIITLVLLGGYILLLFSHWERYKLRLTPTTIAASIFFVSFAISTFVGVDWYRSLWDGHERMLGLFTIIHYLLYYIIVSSVFREWRDWRVLFRIFLLAGSMVVIIGILQKYIDPELLLNKRNPRVSATLGNPIYLSGYGLFLFCIGLLLGILEKKGTIWQWLSFAGAFLGVVGILIGGTRGTLLGFLAAVGIIGLIYTVTLNKEYKKIKQWILIAMGIGVLLLGVAFAYRQSAFVSSIPAVGRLVNMSLTGGTGETRLMAWNIAIDAWQDKPVFGWGPNNYYYAFNEYYNPKFLEFGWGETWFDNAHSAIFNTLATQGIIGIVAYLSLFIIPGVVLVRAYREERISVHVFAISGAFLIGHFVHNAFVFENPTSYMYFFVFLAFINSMTQTYDIDKKSTAKNISIGGILGIGMVILLLIFSSNINTARANMMTLDAIRAYHSGDSMARTQYDNATAIPSPHIDDIRNDYARTIEQIYNKYIKAKRTDDLQKYAIHAYEELEKNIIIHPQDVRVYITQAHLAQMLAGLTQDSTWLIKQEQILEKALALSPKRQQVIYELCVVKSMMGNYDAVIALLEGALEDNDAIADTWYRLIFAYIDAGDLDTAREVYQESQEKGMTFNNDISNKINQALFQ